MKLHNPHILREHENGVDRAVQWKLLSETIVTSNVDTIEFTDMEPDSQYVLQWQHAVPTDNTVDLYFKLSTDNGSSFIATGYTYHMRSGTASSANKSNNATNQAQILLDSVASARLGSTTTEHFAGMIWIYNAGKLNLNKPKFEWFMNGQLSNAQVGRTWGNGQLESDVTANAFQLATGGASGFSEGIFWFYKIH
jgi:hypothetical protein